jgi:hypothetical protein
MLGRIEEALGTLDELSAASNALADSERLALLLLKAELLYLNCRESDALTVFEKEIEGKLPSISQEERFIVGQNKRDVIFGGFLALKGRGGTFLHDQQTIAGTKLWNPTAIVHAYESARSGQHYEALPALWRELLNAYHQRVWSYYRQAARRFAQEFIQIGWAHVADFYVVIGQDTKTAETIAEHLRNWGNAELIEALANRLIMHANLRRHAVVACGMFVRLADVMPDVQVIPTTRWLLQRAAIAPKGFSDEALVNTAWDALESLSPRFDSDTAVEVVNVATSHKSWNEGKKDRVREHIIRAVDACTGLLTVDYLSTIAEKSIHLAKGMSDDINLDKDALHLFLHITTRADAKTKELIRDAIYDKPFANSELLIVAKEFGKTWDNGTEAERLAEDVARDVRLQVQRLDSDKEFEKPQVSLGQMTLTAGPKKVGVSIYSDLGLRALIAHRKLLNEDSIALLMDSVLAMLHEPENVISNKVLMINAITGLADVITPKLADQAFEILEPIASGNVTSIDLSKAVPPNHPLNPNTMNFGKPETIQGGALLALATIESKLSPELRNRAVTLIEGAMVNPHPEVRTLAFIAARRLQAISDSAVITAVLATRDNVEDVVIESFLLLGDHMKDTPEFWNSVVYSAKLASQSTASEIRRVVAYTTKRLSEKCKDDTIQEQLMDIRSVLENDFSYSVRKELSTAAS